MVEQNQKNLKVLISVDMEGICGVTTGAHCTTSNLYSEGQNYMTAETNAAIKGCQEAGATEVVIADAHWLSKNLLQDKLLAPVAPREEEVMMLSGIAGCDLVIFLGYHGKAGGNNFLSHTTSGAWISKVTVNDIEVSEGTLNAAVARELGTKLVFVSGTDAGVEEIRDEVPTAHYMVATTSEGRRKGIPTCDPDEYCEKLQVAVKQAILDHENIALTKSFPDKVHFTVELSRDAPADCPNLTNSRKFEFDSESIYKAHCEYRRVMAILRNY